MGSQEDGQVVLGQVLTMGPDPVPPLILSEGADIFVIASEDDLVTQVEAIDVAAGTYEAVDSEGCSLEISVAGDRFFLQRTAEACDPDALRARLIEHCRHIPEGRLAIPPDMIDQAELPQLLTALLNAKSPTWGVSIHRANWWRPWTWLVLRD